MKHEVSTGFYQYNYSLALTFASGLGASTILMMTLKAGDHVVVSDDVYGGNKKNERVKNSVKKLLFFYQRTYRTKRKNTSDERRSKACERAMNLDN